MKKKALNKDIITEIRKSFNRFISIFLIVALGVAFFSGVRASNPDMRLTADTYLDQYSLMDLKVVSTLGLTHNDVDAIKQRSGVAEVEPSYTIDVLTEAENDQLVLQLIAKTEKMNLVGVSKGRLPVNASECLIDESLASYYGYEIGDKITVKSGTDDSLDEMLAEKTFEVVGIGSTSYFISFERGSSTIGNGKVNGFVIVPPEAFQSDVYTQLFILAAGAKNLISHSYEYEELVTKVSDAVKSIAKDRCEVRYNQLVTEANEALAEAKAELEASELEAREKLAEAAAKLEEGHRQLEEGKTELAIKKQEIEDAKQQIDVNEQKLIDAKAAREEGMTSLEAGKQELKSNESALKEVKMQLERAEENLEIARETYPPDSVYIVELEEQIKQTQEQIAQGEAQLETAREHLALGEANVVEADAQITAAETQLAAAKEQIVTGETQIKEAEETLRQSEADLIKGKEEYEAAKTEADEKIASAKAEIAEGEEEVEKIELPEWYILDRNSLPEYEGVGQNADRIGAIGKVFPAIFFLVAALVSLTTMTRMVEEQRTQIGTLKALGYGKASIASKYVIYAFTATLGGSLFGVLIGEKVFPYIIITSYKIMYPNIRDIVVPYNFQYALTATLLALVCTLFATIFACYRELAAMPAELMRPTAPTKGKRVVLERIIILWRHLTFTQKATCRNIFRYKKRFFMTVFGIGSCMALLVVGFGLRDSIVHIADIQYQEIQLYDGMLSLNEDASEDDKSQLFEYLDSNSLVSDYMQTHIKTIDVEAEGEKRMAYLCVPQSAEEFKKFTILKDRTSNKVYELNDDGAIITEQMAKALDVKPGDLITIKNGDEKPVEIRVAAVTENYMMHYIYMTPTYYKAIFGAPPIYDMLLLSLTEEGKSQEEIIGSEILEKSGALGLNYMSDQKTRIEDMLGSLNIVVGVLIISAGMLAFVVLYNLNNININERKRELATIKVLGFYDMEVAAYVYRENSILTIIGACLGVGLGAILHQYVITTVEVDMVMFGRNVKTLSYIISAGLTFFFSAFVNYVMYFKLKKINMVESLKSVE